MRTASLCTLRPVYLVSAIGLLAVSACRTREPEPVTPPAAPAVARPAPQPPVEPLHNEIPPAELAAVMAAHFKGWATWSNTSIGEAVEAFREVRRRAPGWIPGAINLAIALLNDSGVKAEQAKKAGVNPLPDNFDEALELLAGVLERDPENPYAHFCRGIILEQQGRFAEAHQHFKRVTEIDPNDAAAWYWTGSTLTDPDESVSARRPRAGERADRALYAKPSSSIPT